MVEKKQVHSGKIAGYVMIMNFIAIIIFLVIAKLLDMDITLIKGVCIGVVGFVLNFLGCKYLLNKKYEITDGRLEFNKKLFLSFFIVVITFMSYGVISYNWDKNNRFIQVLPTVNYSEETKAMIYENAKYNVSFGPPIKIITNRDANDKDIEKLKQDIRSEEEKIDNELNENKISWITIITVYAGFSLIGILLVLYNLNKWINAEELVEDVNQNGISKKSLTISIFVILILVAIIIFVSQNLTNKSSTNEILKEDDEKASELSIEKVLKVGDYVEYIPDSNVYSTNTNNTGYEISQKLTTESAKWRVLYVDENTGEVLVTTNGIVNNGTYFEGIKGYLNGPTELNNICKALYSNNDLGITARSLTMEDFNKAYNYTSIINPTRYAYYPKGTMFEEGDTEVEYKGNVYIKTEDNTYRGSRFYSSDGGGKEIIDSDGVSYRTPEEGNPVYITAIEFGQSPDYGFFPAYGILGAQIGWLATSSDVHSSAGIDFGICKFGGIYGDIGYVDLYNSSGVSFKPQSDGLRPVVVLNSMFEVDNNDIERDGSSAEKAWKIIKN